MCGERAVTMLKTRAISGATTTSNIMKNQFNRRNSGKLAVRLSAICLAVAAINFDAASSAPAKPLLKPTANPLANLKAKTRNFSHHTSRKLNQKTAANRVVVGQTMPDFSFSVLNGAPRRFSEMRGHPTLFLFADTSCPCVQAYDSRVQALKTKYARQGLKIVYVFSQPNENSAEIHNFMNRRRFVDAVATDQKQKILNLFKAQCSSEVFLADARGVLRYHGAFDDSTFDIAAVKKPYMAKAVAAVFEKKAVAEPETLAHGCAITRL